MDNILDGFKLTDKVAIVTGAGKGIGKATAVALAQAGAHVVCAARTASDVEETAKLVRATGRRALAVPCDVTKTADLDRLVAATLKEFDRIDILVNNAGGWNPAPAMDINDEDFEYCVRFNLTSSYLLTKRVVTAMVKTAGGGSVINISSAASYMPLVGFVPYGAAKAGLNQMTNLLSTEFAPKVRVNGIVVGVVATPGLFGAAESADQETLKVLTSNIPMRRIGDPKDIAAGVIYLASPAASWVTGHMIHIDGGAVEAPMKFPSPGL